MTSLLESSMILEEIFNHSTMEFFIFVGSLAGQFSHETTANCAAASEFSSALIHGRRSRGLCGSIVFMSQTPDSTSESQFLGERFLSQHELDETFAEAILAGDPNSSENLEITAGLQPFNPEQDEMNWTRVPKMSNFFNHLAASNQVALSRNEIISMSVLLENAISQQEATEIITSHFLTQLRTKLGLSTEAALEKETQLIEMGVDSLVAADLRTWFVQNLAVEVPILLMLSGSSIEEIVGIAVAKLSPNTIPHVQ